MNQQPELISRIQNGDKAGMGAVYDAYAGMVYGVVLKMLKRQELVEEVVQDVFLKVWKNIHSFDPAKARLSTWIINIARNRAIDELRSKSFKQDSENQAIDNSVNEMEGSGSTAPQVETIGVKNLVRHLRPEHQQLIELVYFGGYTHDEAAKQLKIPLGTVKTRLRKSILDLRKLVSSEP